MNELDLIYGTESTIKEFYGFEPGRAIYDLIKEYGQSIGLDEKTSNIVNNKILNYSKKLLMTHNAYEKAIKQELTFIGTQNREWVSLIWNDEIELLYHTEALILFARSALDIAAYVFSLFTIEPLGSFKKDSFNDFTKKLLTTTTDNNKIICQYIRELEDSEFAWYRILCGQEKGRAERDKIVHQTTAKIEYHETSHNSDKEYCHYIIGEYALPFEAFLNSIVEGVFNFINLTENSILENFIKNQHSL